MKMTTKIFTIALLSILVLVFMTGLAVAAPICSGTLCMGVVNAPTTATHGTDVAIRFNVTYEGSAASTTLDFSESTTNIGTFEALPSSTTSINMGQTKELTALLDVPKGQSGTINVVLKVRSSTGSNFDLNVPTITINNNPSLKVRVVQGLTQTQNGIIELENDGNTNLAAIDLSRVSGDFDVAFSEEGFNLAHGEKKSVTITSTNLGDLSISGKSALIRARASDGTTGEVTLSIDGSFCSAGSQGGNLTLRDVKIDNQGDGKDDEWQLLDTVEVEVEVKNDGDDTMDDVFVEIGLFDSNGDNVVSDLDFEDADEEEKDVGNIRDGDTETVTYRFKVPADIEDGSYKLVVKAYSDDLGENAECTDESSDLSNDIYEAVSIERESDEGKFIAFDDIVISPTEATCGDLVSLSANAFNIGDEDQDQLRVNLVSREFNLDEFVEIRNDVDQGDKESVNFEFLVPREMQDGSYQLRLSADYDYRSGTYRESSDEETTVLLRILGCSPTTPPTNDGGEGNVAAISATLDSDAVAGEELIVRTTVTNLKSESATFAIDASGFSSWASLDNISERMLNLGAGESKDVVFTFNVDEDAEGRESFAVDVQSGDQTQTREIEVNIQSASTIDGGVSGGLSGLGDNTFLWIIGIVNVILIILIIVVAVRISRR